MKLVWIIRIGKQRVVWESFTWAVADFLDLRTQGMGRVWIYPSFRTKRALESMPDFMGY